MAPAPPPSPLQQQWLDLHRSTLPAQAKKKDPAQPHWPVVLDHCFARIILDNTVGKGEKPWTEVLEKPAYRHMSDTQLREAINLGEKIGKGEARLVELDEISLRVRGKSSKADKKAAGAANGGRGGKGDERGDRVARQDDAEAKQVVDDTKKHNGTKRKSGDEQPADNDSKPTKRRQSDKKVSSYFLPSPRSPVKAEDSVKAQPAAPSPKQLTNEDDAGAPDLAKDAASKPPPSTRRNPITEEEYPIKDPLTLISESTITPFRKQVLTLLTQVPAGHYTTYQCMSDHITSTSHKTCARAIGNAMRNNPFAPVVPCHRVLATGGTIGGFGGHWGEEGKFASRKREMLRDEGVRFDGKGKVVGSPFTGFK